MTTDSTQGSAIVRLKSRGDRVWTAFAALGLGVMLIVLNWGLLTGRATPMWDADGQGAPYQMLVADYAVQGRLLGWNPWNSGGSPDFAEPQFGAMSPVAVGMGWITGGTLLGYCLYWMLWWWLGGIGIWLLGRHLDSPRWTSWSVAAGFMFGGLYLSDAEHIPFLIGYATLGWMIWRVDAALSGRRWWPMLEAGAIWGLSGLSGYPGIVMMNACFAAMWILGRVMVGGWNVHRKAEPARSEPEAEKLGEVGRILEKVGSRLGPRWPAWSVGLLALALVGVVGTCVLSPTYFGFMYEMRGYTSRSGALDRDFALSTNALHPGAVSALASPVLPIVKLSIQEKLLNQDNPSQAVGLWACSDISGCGFYIGALSIILALFSLVVSPGNKWRWWLFGVGLLGLGLGMGQALPLRGWLYDVFLPARYFRHGVNFRLYFLFVLAVLALEGGRELETRERRRWLILGTVATLAAVAAFVAMNAVATAIKGESQLFSTAWIHAGLAWGGVAALAWIGSLRTDERWQRGFIIALAVFATLDAVGSRWISSPLVETRRRDFVSIWKKLDENHTDELDLTKVGLQRTIRAQIPEEPNNKNLIIKEASLFTYSTLGNAYVNAWTFDPVLVPTVLGPDRLWYSAAAVEAGVNNEGFDAFTLRAREIGGLPAVIHSPEAMLGLQGGSPGADVAAIRKAPAARRIGYELELYDPDRLVLKVRCPQNGWLFVTDRWARSWRAEVNGKATPVLGGDFAFRAIAVEAGENRIAMEFVPMGRGWLMGLSWGLLGAVLLGSGLGMLGGRSEA